MTTLTTSHRAARSLTLPQATQTPTINDRSRAAALISPAQAVQAAARAFSSAALQPVCAPGAGLAFQARSLLAILTYCYAREIYSSAEVEDLMRSDLVLRSACGNAIPDALTLRRFRRCNHEAIEQCLFTVLRMLADQRGVHPADAEVFEEAHQRLKTAMLMDLNEN
jgi:hypothetical protein